MWRGRTVYVDGEGGMDGIRGGDVGGGRGCGSQTFIMKGLLPRRPSSRVDELRCDIRLAGEITSGNHPKIKTLTRTICALFFLRGGPLPQDFLWRAASSRSAA